MLRMSIVIRLLLLDVVVIVNIAVAVIMVGSAKSASKSRLFICSWILEVD